MFDQRLDQAKTEAAASTGDDNFLVFQVHRFAPLFECSQNDRGHEKESRCLIGNAGQRFVAARSASAMAPNERRPSASTSAPFRPAISDPRPSRVHSAGRYQEQPSAAP